MKINKVLILGSGALKIGQAGEFDYSGSQAIKALKEEQIKTVVVNPNIATMQTSRDFADEVYFLPVTPYFVEKIIEKERPDGIFLAFGGQTALNCGVALHTSGVLQKYGVRVLGSPIDSIVLTEDREAFANHLKKINQPVPESRAVKTEQRAVKAAAEIGYPVMVRAAYALGGQSSGVVFSNEQLLERAREAFAFSPQLLIEKYLHHFKEIEYEVVRDADDNCITVCNMENMDPLGIHTGESIVVAPSQTLTNHEYHTLRQISIDIVRSLGIVGECNIQFAVNPIHADNSKLTVGNSKRENEIRNEKLKIRTSKNQTSNFKNLTSNLQHQISKLDYYIIEVNARLSRSSALASKATGYPLAYVAAKLALGKKLAEIPNQVTKVTQSFFEPALDYLVVKMPRWDIEKFRGADEQIGSSMKSVGEVMGIGRSFPEALQKATRMLEIGVDGVTDWCYLRNKQDHFEPLGDIMKMHVERPTPKRLFALSYALYKGVSTEELQEKTGINLWFLQQLQRIVDGFRLLEKHRKEQGKGKRLNRLSMKKDDLLRLKQDGYSDSQIAHELSLEEDIVRRKRKAYHITPAIFQIDTLAAEFPAKTNYLYTTYHGSHHDVTPLKKRAVIVLGSGPYRIGSSVEFDWSCVSASRRLAFHRKQSIIINSNPETVSTDYDVSDRLYFDELTLERILDIYEFENPYGMMLSVGGQTPNTLAPLLAKHRVRLLGTAAADIDRAEDRNKFSDALDKLKISQPEWTSAASIVEAKRFVNHVGFPVLIRPSYVLSGSAMSICRNMADLERFLKQATTVSPRYPVTISKFMEEAKEIELDAIACHGVIKLYAISEHVEKAGVHSGDATIVFPASRIYIETQQQIIRTARLLAKEFHITGPFNIQFLAKNNHVHIIELNMRASRTIPFVSKALDRNFAAKSVDAVFHRCTSEAYTYPTYSVVKTPQFSFSRLTGADPVLHVEMASTGEVGCFGDDREEAFLKAMLAVDYIRPKKNVLVSIGKAYKEQMRDSIMRLHIMGYELYATEGTAEFLKDNQIDSTIIKKAYEVGADYIIRLIRSREIDLVIVIRDREHEGIAQSLIQKERTDGYRLRRAAADNNVPLMTDQSATKLFVRALARKKTEDLKIQSWREYIE